MSAAVRSLRESGKYNGKVRFYIVQVDSKKVRDEIAAWKVIGNHGLVGTSPKRELLVSIAGHDFGKNAVVEKVEELLKKTGPPSTPPSKTP